MRGGEVADTPKGSYSSSSDDESASSKDSVDPQVEAPEVGASNEKKCRTVAAEIMGKRNPCRGPPKQADTGAVWIHSRRGTAHFGHVEDEAKLACGRPKNEVYDLVEVDPETHWPRCSDCFPDGE